VKTEIEAEEDLEALGLLVDPLIKTAKRSEEYISERKPDELLKEDKVAYRVWQVLEDRAIILHIWMIVLSIPVIVYGRSNT
jgi:hypothetical protein